MKCLFPVRMYRSSLDGTVSHTIHKVKSPTDIWRQCGQCINCRLSKAESWAIRLTHESKMHDKSCFVTLTYNDENLPKFGSLNYDDVTLFLKKTRSLYDYTLKKKFLISMLVSMVLIILVLIITYASLVLI